jgi:Zn-dependent peptidase ImmA (M78 family)/transcriptional regulator with XRE-family HTH domain
MPSTVRANVKPELIRWARTTYGIDLAQAARKAQISEDKIAAWEAGAEQPTVNQLRDLGRIYKRPLAAFYLPNVPRDFQPQRIQDFRRLPDTSTTGEFSPKLRTEIRRTLYRRQVALDLFENLEQTPTPFQLSAVIDEDPERVASRIRQSMGLTLSVQSQWSSQGHDAFGQMRQAVERQGILVFQASVDLEEMRGLAIFDDPLPVILVSSKEEFMAPRLFTLFHELVHLMLHRSAISNGAETGIDEESARIEVFANHCAAAALVPMDSLLQDLETLGLSQVRSFSDDVVRQLARRYRVSWETVLRRLLTARKVSSDEYKETRERWQAELAVRPRRAPGTPRIHITELSRTGDLFPRLVLQNFYQEKITAPEVADYLNLKLKHLPMVEAELRTRRFAPLQE